MLLLPLLFLFVYFPLEYVLSNPIDHLGLKQDLLTVVVELLTVAVMLAVMLAAVVVMKY